MKKVIIITKMMNKVSAIISKYRKKSVFYWIGTRVTLKHVIKYNLSVTDSLKVDFTRAVSGLQVFIVNANSFIEENCPYFKKHPVLAKAFSSELIFFQRDFVRGSNVSLLLIMIPKLLGMYCYRWSFRKY